jgi:hypothetical protein
MNILHILICLFQTSDVGCVYFMYSIYFQGRTKSNKGNDIDIRLNLEPKICHAKFI